MTRSYWSSPAAAAGQAATLACRAARPAARSGPTLAVTVETARRPVANQETTVARAVPPTVAPRRAALVVVVSPPAEMAETAAVRVTSGVRAVAAVAVVTSVLAVAAAVRIQAVALAAAAQALSLRWRLASRPMRSTLRESLS